MNAKKVILVVALVLVAGAVLAFAVIRSVGRSLQPLAPDEYTDDAVPRFRAEFPAIYHLLVENGDFDDVRFRVLRGRGGRWGKLTLTPKEGATTDRETAAARLRQAFDDAGWQPPTDSPPTTRNADNIFYGKGPHPHDADDLVYSHPRLPNESKDITHHCRVFISKDATTIVAYCEMGW